MNTSSNSKSTPSDLPANKPFARTHFPLSPKQLIPDHFQGPKKTTGVAPPIPIPFTILDLQNRPGYCANETPVASQPPSAAVPVSAPLRLDVKSLQIASVPR